MPAIAAEFGIPLTIDDFAAVADRTPLIAAVLIFGDAVEAVVAAELIRVVARGQFRVRVRAVQRRVCVSGKHPMHRGRSGGPRSRLHDDVLQVRRRLRLRLLCE